jgi:AcrR family transcriptional regulator
MAVPQTSRMPVDLAPRKKLSKAGQKTADDILIAAEKLFTQKGFKATTLKEVSEASSANTALISYYFGNKDGLRDAVFAKQLQKAGSGFEALFAVDPLGFNVDSFRQLIRVFLDTADNDDTLFKMVTWSTVDEGAIADKMSQVIWEPFFGRLTDIIVHLGQGRFTRNEAVLRTWALLGCVHGYVHARWHTANHMKLLDPREVFFESYKNLIVEKVTTSLLGA